MPVLLPNEVTQRHGERLAILQLHPLSIRCCAWCSYSLSATKHKGKNTVTMYSMRERMRFALKRLHLIFPITKF